MPGQNAQRRKACLGKQRYATHADAEAALRALAQGRDWQSWLAVYRCGFCGGHHVGHVPAKVRQAILARRQEVQ